MSHNKAFVRTNAYLTKEKKKNGYKGMVYEKKMEVDYVNYSQGVRPALWYKIVSDE